MPTPAVMTAKDPNLDELRAAYDSIYSLANEANFQTWTNAARVYGDWAAAISTAILSVESAQAAQGAETSTEEPTSTATSLTSGTTTRSRPRSTTVVVKTQSAGVESAEWASVSSADDWSHSILLQH